MHHATNAGTYSQFRGEVQRFLNYFWVIRKKSLREIGGDDVDGYMEFVKKPPASWCTSKGSAEKKGEGRQRGYISKHGLRMANPKWRPFYDSGTRRKAATMNAVVAGLTIFFKKLVISEYLPRSPMIDATLRAQKASKSEHSGNQKGMYAASTILAVYRRLRRPQ
jgi:hypothetical protein